MPVIGGSAYPVAGQVLSRARTFIDDAYTAAGQILTGTIPGPAVPMSYQYLNSAYVYIQNELTNAGIETFVQEIILSPFPAYNGPAPEDPSIQASLSDTGYFNGYENYNPPMLPIEMLGPLKLWERQTGATTAFFTPMHEANDGLPQQSNAYKFGFWEWRQDGICMPACTQTNDIRIRYNMILNPLVQDTDPVLIRGNSIDPVAYFTAWSYALTSGDSMIADKLFQAATAFLTQMTLTSSRRNQRGSHRRAGYGRRRGFETWAR